MTTPENLALRENLPVILPFRLNQASQDGPNQNQWMHHIYLLQHAYNVPLGYRFTLFPAGPRSPRVQQDLQVARDRSTVSISRDPKSSTYRILPGPNAHQHLDAAITAWKPHTDAMSSLVENFALLAPSQLSLMAIVHIIATTPDKKPPDLPVITVIKATHAVKPHACYQEIREAINYLRERDLLT